MRWSTKTAIGLGALGALSIVYRKYTRIDLQSRSVVITGGSRGLGLELAREFAAQGARIALLARDKDELGRARDELADAEVITVPCDVRVADDVSDAVDEVMAARGGIDVLVNAAGVIDVAPLEHLTEREFEDSIATHFWGPLYLIRNIRDRMKPGSRIVNISSIGGLVAVPHLLSYSTGKFALTGLSEGLHAELSRHGIYVTTVCPGLMRTGSHVKARFKGRHEEEFAWFAVSAACPAVSMDARRAAKKIVEACRTGQPFLILTPQARALHLLHALAPNTTLRIMSVAARLLPEPAPRPQGDGKREGWQSTSTAAPSILTRLADHASRRNNELDDREKRVYDDGP